MLCVLCCSVLIQVQAVVVRNFAHFSFNLAFLALCLILFFSRSVLRRCSHLHPCRCSVSWRHTTNVQPDRVRCACQRVSLLCLFAVMFVSLFVPNCCWLVIPLCWGSTNDGFCSKLNAIAVGFQRGQHAQQHAEAAHNKERYDHPPVI